MTRSILSREVLRGSQRCLRAAEQRLVPTWQLAARGRGPRLFHNAHPRRGPAESGLQIDDLMKDYEKAFEYPRASALDQPHVGDTVTIHGFLSGRRSQHGKLMFVDVSSPNGAKHQVTSAWQETQSAEHARHQALKNVTLHSPVSVTGKVIMVDEEGNPANTRSDVASTESKRVDLELVDFQVLNAFPKTIIVSKGVQFPPSKRHLQLRFSEALQYRLQFRDYINQKARKYLQKLSFREYETPLLFKSTPEGAREFLVPTRPRGYAYALPQSPQQFKQLLMASGLGRYYQFARCFRDEDHRADRQPEFTQLDLEMPFATGIDVMQTVEEVMRSTYNDIRQDWIIGLGDQGVRPKKQGLVVSDAWRELPDIDPVFRHISYNETMTKYGSDKPDLRIQNEIHRIEHLVPKSFTSMITSLDDPIVEAVRFRLDGRSNDLQRLVGEMMEDLPLPARQNPDGAPVMLIFDPGKPMGGLSSLGHEGLEGLMGENAHFSDIQQGDLLLIQARENKPLSGGGTVLGVMRSTLYNKAVAAGLLPKDHSFQFAWITGFPMFTPNTDADPGQGGSAGFSSMHHPFTAPLTAEDFRLLASDPLKATADHYDLVVNGVELGGGSRRIHVAAVQEYVMRDILQMSDVGVKQFKHLLDALAAGCPPHAGFALGFDRLIAVLSGTDSVRDVIAFPKSNKGKDLMVGSPSWMTKGQQEMLLPERAQATISTAAA